MQLRSRLLGGVRGRQDGQLRRRRDHDRGMSGCPTSQCGKATCTEGLPCAMAAKCNGSEVWYCEQKSPAAFDCKSVGMNCAMAANGPRCQ
jgi:hypothetical protein